MQTRPHKVKSNMANRFIVLDLETNGIGSMHPPRQTITQFAWILFDENGTTLDYGNDVVSGATQVRKFYDNALGLDEINERGIPLQCAFDKMVIHIDERTTLYAHNADFDIGLIKYAGLQLPDVKIVCTMKNSIEFCKMPKTGLAAFRYPGGYKYPRLSELASKLKLKLDESKLHDALYDCEITKMCVLEGKKYYLFY